MKNYSHAHPTTTKKSSKFTVTCRLNYTQYYNAISQSYIFKQGTGHDHPTRVRPTFNENDDA